MRAGVKKQGNVHEHKTAGIKIKLESQFITMSKEKALEIMSFDRTANPTKKEIDKKYRTLAGIKHPDRGGDEDDFKALKEAHETLLTVLEKPNKQHAPDAEDLTIPIKASDSFQEIHAFVIGPLNGGGDVLKEKVQRKIQEKIDFYHQFLDEEIWAPAYVEDIFIFKDILDSKNGKYYDQKVVKNFNDFFEKIKPKIIININEDIDVKKKEVETLRALISSGVSKKILESRVKHLTDALGNFKKSLYKHPHLGDEGVIKNLEELFNLSKSLILENMNDPLLDKALIKEFNTLFEDPIQEEIKKINEINNISVKSFRVIHEEIKKILSARTLSTKGKDLKIKEAINEKIIKKINVYKNLLDSNKFVLNDLSEIKDNLVDLLSINYSSRRNYYDTSVLNLIDDLLKKIEKIEKEFREEQEKIKDAAKVKVKKIIHNIDEFFESQKKIEAIDCAKHSFIEINEILSTKTSQEILEIPEIKSNIYEKILEKKFFYEKRLKINEIKIEEVIKIIDDCKRFFEVQNIKYYLEKKVNNHEYDIKGQVSDFYSKECKAALKKQVEQSLLTLLLSSRSDGLNVNEFKIKANNFLDDFTRQVKFYVNVVGLVSLLEGIYTRPDFKENGITYFIRRYLNKCVADFLEPYFRAFSQEAPEAVAKEGLDLIQKEKLDLSQFEPPKKI